MQVKALRLQDVNYGDQWDEEVEDRWEYNDFRSDSAWREGWISMDSVYHNADDDRVYLGITSFNADIFRAYDRATGEFVDLGYAKVANPFDAKFHRSLVRWEKDGCLYGAIALLHDIDRYWEAPGGAIVKYDPATGELQKIAVPMPHMYIQSICLDQERGLIYGMTFTPERMFRFNLADGRSDDLGPISSGMEMAQGENVELDDEGCVWCGWSVTRAWQNFAGVDRNRLCKFNPERTGSSITMRAFSSRTAATGMKKLRVSSTWVKAVCSPAAPTGRFTGSIRKPGWARTWVRPLQTGAAG
jgi:hypothetical protein